MFDTRAVHAGRRDLRELGVHAPPIDLSTTAPLPGVEAGGADYETLAAGGRPRAAGSTVYQRLWNPTVARFEDAMAELEGGDGAVAFASGMAALTAALLSAIGRPHVVAVRPLYGGSDHLLATRQLGTEVTFVHADAVRRALRPDTGLVLVETPANPTLDLVDLRELAATCGDVPLLVDNTFATPVLQRPLELGAALVLHSATKFIGGHGDVMGGVVVADKEWTERLRRTRAITGGLLSPMSAYLLHRGLPTLPLRVRAQQESASWLARWLAEHPVVAAVHHPSLTTTDPTGLVGRQMSGPGSLLAFELHGGYEAAATVAESVRLISHAVSLGGVDSLIQHPAGLTHRPVAHDARPSAGLLRLSVGLEDVEDLVADLADALTLVGRGVAPRPSVSVP